MEPRGEVGFGAGVSVGAFRVREVTYPAGYRQGTHAHEQSTVTLILAGSLRERAGRQRETAGALSVVAKRGGVEHSDHFGPEGARTVQIALAPDAGPLDPADGPSLPAWRWYHDARAAGPLLTLRSLVHGGGDVPDGEIEDAVTDCLGAVTAGTTPGGPVPDWLTLTREALDDALPGSVPVRRLAAEVDVHPVSLSRAFRRHYGCTVTEYRRGRRVCRAAKLLSETGRDISRIAYAAGFADHPHLCRTFRAYTGLTPGAFRRLAPEDGTPR